MEETGRILSTGADPVRRQCAALCWRAGRDGIEVLLITSRDTGRWVVPKGWPMPGRTIAESAVQEAYEEAGVRGMVDPQGLGRYGYDKVIGRGAEAARQVPCIVTLFALRVTSQTDRFPEKGQRRLAWLARSEAAQLVGEPDLQRMIAAFEPGDQAGTAL